MNQIAAQLGEVGLPAPLEELAARQWDAVVVGGGHNGLTAAAYLARAGKSVLVLEARERLGGACTLERPFDGDFQISPCAYVVGLLDEVVIQELGLRARGYECYIADPNLWVPFADGTSFGQWLDDSKTQAGDLLLDAGLELLELNPVIVGVTGAVAVDALAVRRTAPASLSPTPIATGGTA